MVVRTNKINLLYFITITFPLINKQLIAFVYMLDYIYKLTLDKITKTHRIASCFFYNQPFFDNSPLCIACHIILYRVIHVNSVFQVMFVPAFFR